MTRKTLCILVGLILLQSTVLAVELDYKWKKGDVHRFSYADETRFDVEMPGMDGMKAKVKVESVFSEKVLRVKPDGKADVELVIEKLDIYQEGKKLATIQKVPPAARMVKAEVDKKGRAKFYKMVTVYIHDNAVYVGIHNASVGPRSASASATASGPEGSVTVDLVASVDPKTGRITASAKVTERPPALKKVKIKQEDPAVDVLPKGIFEMMVMPDGSIEPGDEQEVKLPFVTMTVALDELQGAVANLKTRSKVTDDSGGGGMPGMGGGMPGMPDTDGMPDMGGMMKDALGGGGLQLKTDAATRFDTGKGRLLGIEGTMGMEMSMGGMGGIKTNSSFTLRRI
jgi:hypothetical protein